MDTSLEAVKLCVRHTTTFSSQNCGSLLDSVHIRYNKEGILQGKDRPLNQEEPFTALKARALRLDVIDKTYPEPFWELEGHERLAEMQARHSRQLTAP